jgi:hypothetical protein
MGIQDTVTDDVSRMEHPGSTATDGRRLDVDGTRCEAAVDGARPRAPRGIRRENRRVTGRGRSGENETSGRLGAVGSGVRLG